MKKFYLFIVSFLFVVTAVAQKSYPNKISDKITNNNRDVTSLTCPGASVYAQLPDGSTFFPAEAQNTLYDDILLSSPETVHEITFWMLEIQMSEPLVIDITFRHDQGNIPGTIFSYYPSVSIVGVFTGELVGGYRVMEYTYAFPSDITVTPGDWVGILPLTSSIHYFASSSDGNSLTINYPSLSTIGEDISFCLGAPTPVPVSSWALLISVLLISVFLIFKLKTNLFF